MFVYQCGLSLDERGASKSKQELFLMAKVLSFVANFAPLHCSAIAMPSKGS
jgi:hypothetical protein